MDVIYGLMIAMHILVSSLLIIAVLLQPGKGGGGLGAAFGGGASNSVFGGRGATSFLSKTTGVLAALFFVLSIAIAMTGSESSITDEPQATPAPAEAPTTAPAPTPTPAPAPAPEPAESPAQ